MSLRPPSTPRASISSIPAPGSTPSSLPTPRRKSGISITQRPPALQALGSNELDSLRQAVRRNDPTRYDSPVGEASASGNADSPSPAEALGVSTPGQPRRAPLRKASSANVRPGGLGASLSRPTTPSNGSSTPRTPTHPPRSRTPTAFGSSVSGRPSSRLAMSRGPSSSSSGLEVGDAVTIEVGGVAMEGTIRFLGPVEGKDGEWGGVELDAEWEGKGKNDGSVKGTQYFACAPLCGLFLPLSKITAKPPPRVPITSPNTPIASKITAGSRASKYLGVTAAQLATNRRVSNVGPSSPSKATSTPRRVASPEKPSSASSQTTPKPRARQSMGGAGFGIPTPRKSIGPGATPRQSLGASIKRPPSSLRKNNLPDVPPIPNSFSLARSATPSSTGGRATPSTPGGAHTRRMSLASHESRPTTPSVRSHSRQSFASSVSRQSFRSTVDDEALDELKRAAEEAKQREEEVRALLEGSERIGREMEDRLAEKERRLKEAEERAETLEQERNLERNREKERELARMAGVGDEDKEQDARRVLELEARVEELVKAEAATKASTERLSREWETKFAAKEGENESLRERMAAAAKEAEEERADLNQQLDQLRGAGQALCETYEERIAEIELSRLESVELAETLQEQLNSLNSNGAVRASSPSSPTSPTSRLSSSHNSRTSAADVINAESAQAELEHLQSKVGSLEEQLEETRMHLEAEIADSKRRRAKHGETEQTLKKEIKTLRESIERSTKAEARTTARIEELEDALLESQTALEEERSELEGLRHDASDGASAGLAEEVKRANKQIAALKAERQAALTEAEDARRDGTHNAELVQQLREDLRTAEKELDRLQLADPGLQMRSDSFSSERSKTPPQQPTQDTTPSSLQPSPSHKRDSIASIGSRKSLGGKDEATITKEQIVGLKVIIKGLEEENAEMAERNKQLMGETRELKDAHRALEVTVENLMTEMTKGGGAAPTSPNVDRRESLTDDSLRREVDELKTQLKEVEKRSEREIKALNQEVSELESLVESKIYAEDELVTELEKYKSLAAKSTGAASSSSSQPRVNGTSIVQDDEEGCCEMCGQLGHELDDCPIFAGSAPSPTKASRRSDSPTPSGHSRSASGAEREFCDDCEEYGHSLENCTLSSEIF